MKRGQIAIFILVGLFFVGAIILLVSLKSANPPVVENRECTADADCVPNICCNAKLCVPADEGPDCSNVDCPPGCAGHIGNLDGEKFLGCATDTNPRGLGSCACVNEKCTPTG